MVTFYVYLGIPMVFQRIYFINFQYGTARVVCSYWHSALKSFKIQLE